MNYTYNANKQVTKCVTTAYGDNTKKTAYTEYWNYLSGKNVLLNTIDRLGNKTAYEYTDSTYYIPTAVKQFADTENEQVTENILSSDKKVILSKKEHYDDRILITNYGYSTTYPGNVTSETLVEQKNQTETVLNTTTYAYNTDTGCAGEAYVTQKTISGTTYSSAFEPGAAVAATTNYTYYRDSGQVKTETIGTGQTTQYEYNKNGWITKIIYPDMTYKEMEYILTGNDNRIVTSHNGSYITTDYFDKLGRVIKQTESAGSISEKTLLTYMYMYDDLYSITDANGNKTYYLYDAFKRVTAQRRWSESSEILTSTIAYDDYNNTIRISTGGKSAITYYDIMGRVIKEEVNSGAGLVTRTTEYDEMGNLSVVTDPNGGQVSYGYDDRGNVVSVVNELGQETVYQYDAFGNITQMTTPGGSQTTYEYDSLGRNVKITDALNQSEYRTYDMLGNLAGTKDRKGQTAQFTYDSMNRLKMEARGGNPIFYTYDDFGNRKTLTDQAGGISYSYSYTYNNRLETINAPGGKSITYGYDDVGNVTSVNGYNGQTVSYQYDTANRLQAVSEGGTVLAQYEYHPFGALKKVTYPGQGTMEYAYDDAVRLVSAVNKLNDNTAVNTYTYTYDLNGNQLTKTDNTEQTTYTYDAANRLKSITEPDGTSTGYSFDANGNIMTKAVTHPAEYEYTFQQDGTEFTLGGIATHTVNYTYDKNNRLLQEREFIGGDGTDYAGLVEILRQYTYDANGNTTKRTTSGQVDAEVVEYTYDALNRLTQYKDAQNNVTTYAYNADGERVSKTQNGVTTNYYWDRGYISAETAGSSTVTNYVGVGGVFARKSGTQTDYLFKNGHGDVTAKVSGGVVTKTYNYDAYGVEKNPDANDTNPFRYCGEYFDSESESIYLRNRYYSPLSSRFITEDPICSGSNWYAYCSNNPIMFVDPMGLSPRGNSYYLVIFAGITQNEGSWDVGEAFKQQIREDNPNNTIHVLYIYPYDGGENDYVSDVGDVVKYGWSFNKSKIQEMAQAVKDNYWGDDYIYFIGYSGGGVAAVVTAERLDADGWKPYISGILRVGSPRYAVNQYWYNRVYDYIREGDIVPNSQVEPLYIGTKLKFKHPQQRILDLVGDGDNGIDKHLSYWATDASHTNALGVTNLTATAWAMSRVILRK